MAISKFLSSNVPVVLIHFRTGEMWRNEQLVEVQYKIISGDGYINV